MKKLLLLPITLPLGMFRGAVEAALRTTADALLELAGRGDGAAEDHDAPSAAPPAPVDDGRDAGAVVDFDLGAAAPRRRPASRPARSAAEAAPAPAPQEVAEALGLEEGHTQEEPDELVESEGAADPGPEIAVDEPWPGYRAMRAQEIVARLGSADAATKAIVRLYEQLHRNRRTIIAATD